MFVASLLFYNSFFLSSYSVLFFPHRGVGVLEIEIRTMQNAIIFVYFIVPHPHYTTIAKCKDTRSEDKLPSRKSCLNLFSFFFFFKKKCPCGYTEKEFIVQKLYVNVTLYSFLLIYYAYYDNHISHHLYYTFYAYILCHSQ